MGSCCDRFNIKESYLLIDIIGSFADFKNSVKKSHDGNILPTNYSLHNSEITRSSNDNKKQYRDSPPLPAPNDKVSNETPTTGRRTPRTQSHPDTSTHKPITPLLSPTQLLNHTFESTDDYYTGAPNQQNFELKLTPIDSSQLDMLHHSSHSDGMLSSSSGAPMTAFEDSYGALINQVISYIYTVIYWEYCFLIFLFSYFLISYL